MRLLALLSLLLLALPALAGDEGTADPAADYQVEVDPKIYPSAEFEAKGVKSGNIPPRVKRPDALPDKRDREATFDRVPGLAADLAGMDELARDLLFVRAKNYSLSELRKHYPKIDGKKLARLKREAAK